MPTASARSTSFWTAGHLPTLFTALLYFDFCFAVWVLNAAMAPFISEDLALSPGDKGLMLAVPVFAGALMRFPLGLVSQYIGRKRAAVVEMSLCIAGLVFGWLVVDSYTSVIIMGVILGVAGASFGVALSLGAGWFPAKYKGLAMGIAGAGNSGAVLAMLFAPPLAKAYGWKAVYGLAAIPMLVAMVLLIWLAKEPPDREEKKLSDYLKVLVDKDAWVFNLIYMVTFGGYIGLTSFLPTLFHDQYGLAKESVGQYAAGIVIAASVLRVAGGWLADKVGGLRLLYALLGIVVVTGAAAATLPSDPRVLVAFMIVLFAALGAGNGAVFQLVPLRFPGSTAVAGSLIGEIGALAGGLVPIAFGSFKMWTGSFAAGFWLVMVLSLASAVVLLIVGGRWSRTWIGEGGRARGAVGGATPPAGTAAVGVEGVNA